MSSYDPSGKVLSAILSRYATMTKRELLDEWFATATMAASGSEHSRDVDRTLNLIDAVGELRFPADWNEWDSVK